MKPKNLDTQASNLEFGIEIETTIPNGALVVGGYHRGAPVTTARKPDGTVIEAPTINGQTWNAELDSSIRASGSMKACEFVSPRLCGEAGLANLKAFIQFIREIGGAVNDSCGIHITVGIEKVIGTSNPTEVGEYCRKLARYARRHQWAIFGQTANGRHLNTYCSPLNDGKQEAAEKIGTRRDKSTHANDVGRGIINFLKTFTAPGNPVEFRPFAATLEANLIFHHLATVLGIVRKCATSRPQPAVNPCKTVPIKSAPHALRRMYDGFGWAGKGCKNPLACGLFGFLHTDIKAIAKAGMKAAKAFETRYPNANL